MQGAQKLRSEAHLRVRRNDKVEAQRRRWTFYATITFQIFHVVTRQTEGDIRGILIIINILAEVNVRIWGQALIIKYFFFVAFLHSFSIASTRYAIYLTLFGPNQLSRRARKTGKKIIHGDGFNPWPQSRYGGLFPSRCINKEALYTIIRDGAGQALKGVCHLGDNGS